MGRPAKSVKVKSGAIAGDDAAIRQDVENKLRGENTPPDPPACLTDEQREIFQFIVDGLAESEILGRLDVFVLESTAVAIDRLHAINNMIVANPQLIINTSPTPFIASVTLPHKGRASFTLQFRGKSQRTFGYIGAYLYPYRSHPRRTL